MKIFVYHIWKSWPRYYCKNMENFLIFHIWKFPYEIWNSLHFTSEIWPHIIIWNITCSLYHSHKSLLKFSYMKDWNLCTSHMKIHLHMKSRILYTSDTRICAAILLHKIFNSVIFHNWKIMVAILLNYIPNSVYVTYENPDADFSLWHIEILVFHFIRIWMLLSYPKCGILYTSHMNIWVVIFLNEIWNYLYFTYENLGIGFLQIQRVIMELESSLLYKWKSGHHSFFKKYGILSISQTYIKGTNFHHEIQRILYFLYQNLSPNPPSWKLLLLLLLLLHRFSCARPRATE